MSDSSNAVPSGRTRFDWMHKAIKHVSRVSRGASPRPIDDPKYFDDEGEFAWVRIADVSASSGVLQQTTQRLSALGASLSVPIMPGELFISIAGTVGKPCISGLKACIHDGFVYFPDLAPEYRKFLYYVFEAGEVYKGLGKFGTQLNLNTDTVGSIVIPIPSPLGAIEIVNFLDDKTARIDALIAEKERLLASLVEWRAAELTRICFGEHLSPVPTGNPWLPHLPKGWKVMRLKHLVTGIEQGWSPECESRLAEHDEWGVLKAGAANAGVFREDEHKALPASLEPLPELEVKARDVLITRASGTADYVGSFAYVYATRPKLMLSDKNFRLKFSDEQELLPELLAWMCNTRVLREQILQFVSGADGLAKNIGSGNLRELWLAVPPIDSQPRLISELHASRAKLDRLTEHVVEHIARLREYRSSLISAAVTGQLDIASSKEVA